MGEKGATFVRMPIQCGDSGPYSTLARAADSVAHHDVAANIDKGNKKSCLGHRAVEQPAQDRESLLFCSQNSHRPVWYLLYSLESASGHRVHRVQPI